MMDAPWQSAPAGSRCGPKLRRPAIAPVLRMACPFQGRRNILRSAGTHSVDKSFECDPGTATAACKPVPAEACTTSPPRIPQVGANRCTARQRSYWAADPSSGRRAVSRMSMMGTSAIAAAPMT